MQEIMEEVYVPLSSPEETKHNVTTPMRSNVRSNYLHFTPLSSSGLDRARPRTSLLRSKSADPCVGVRFSAPPYWGGLGYGWWAADLSQHIS